MEFKNANMLNEDLDTHYVKPKFIHNKKKPFKCKKCKSLFAEEALLYDHNARMHNDDPTPCDVCQKICRNATVFLSHKARHDRNREICKVCEKIFYSKYRLRIHERIHTGEKPHSCTYCPKSFKRKDFCINHERTHTGERPHICPICERGFSQRTSMKVHETTHRTDKPFQCNICAKQFKSKIRCNVHMKMCGAKKKGKNQMPNKDQHNQPSSL